MNFRKKILVLLPKGSFARNVGILAGGTALSQVIMIATLPILTRLYTPNDFTILAVYMAALGILTAVACGRYNIAIPIPNNDDEAINLTALSLAVSTVVSVLLAIIIIVSPSKVADLLGQKQFEAYLWMIPAGVFLSSAYSTLEFWATRHKRFTLVTKTRMTRALGGTGTQLGFGFGAPNPFGLLFGHMIYSGMGVFGLARSIWKNDRKSLSRVSYAMLGSTALEYKKYPLYSVPEALCNVAGIQVPVLIIAAYTVGGEAGFLMLALRVMSVPLGLIGVSVAQVYISTAPESYRNGSLDKFTIRTMFSLLKVGGLPLLTLGCLAPLTFGLIFGEEWRRAGEIVLWLTPWFVIQFIVSPVSVGLHVIGKVQVAMWLQVSGAVLRIGSVLIATVYFNDNIVEIYAVSAFLFYLIYLAVVSRMVMFPKKWSR